MRSSANPKPSDRALPPTHARSAPLLREDDTRGWTAFQSLESCRCQIKCSFWTNAIPGSRVVKTDLGLRETPSLDVSVLHGAGILCASAVPGPPSPPTSKSDAPASAGLTLWLLRGREQQEPRTHKVDLLVSFWKSVVTDKSHYP